MTPEDIGKLKRKAFYDQYQGDFVDDPLLREIERLASLYEETTEAYDWRVCSGTSDRGVAVAVNGREQGLISKHACEVQARIMAEAGPLGITWRQIKDAMNGRR